MNLRFTLTAFLILCSSTLFGQRYFEEVFETFQVETDVEYCTQLSLESGVPVEVPLHVDIYSPPATDEVIDKPVVILLHTGNFLTRQLDSGLGINGQATGAKDDSSLVYIARILAKRGFLVASADYRLGWAATANDPDVRKEGILKAYYRSIQDVRTCVRWFRKQHAEDDNPYGINPEKIGVIGQGTGGYIMYGAAAVDDVSEISLEEILNPNNGLPFIDVEVQGNIWGTDQTEELIPNYVEYDSNIQFGANFGGACGTENWIDENTPPMCGLHVIFDPYAPYDCDGDVIVPSTGEFVIEVDGTKCAINVANEIGANDVLNNVIFNDVYTERAAAVGEGVPHLFPIVTAGEESGPWDYWEEEYWSQVTAIGQTINVHENMLLGNPDYSIEKSMAYVDTIVNFTIPRFIVAAEIDGYESFEVVGIDDQLDKEINMYPNPTSSQLTIVNANPANGILNFQIVNMEGKTILNQDLDMDASHTVDLDRLQTGMYNVYLRTQQGLINKKLVIQ